MNQDYQLLAKIFNSNVLNQIADGDRSYLNKVLRTFFDGDDSLDLRTIFDESFKILSQEYLNEYVYKNFIVNKILRGKHSLNTATMLSEFRVGRNKADCVILNGKSTCYEIKTDYDTLNRLDAQLASYAQLFDEVNVVCSYKHLEAVATQIPENVGIILLSDMLTFREVRPAISRCSDINKTLMMQSLRKDEYLELSRMLSGEKISAPNTQLFDKCLDVVNNFKDEEKINDCFIKILKKSRKNDEILISSLPRSLSNAAVSYKFNKAQVESLIKQFNGMENDNVLPNTERKIKRAISIT